MQSSLYVGRVRHQRMTPVKHEFTYRMWLAWLDLNELEEVFRGRLLWSTNRFALLRFQRKDHLGDPGMTLEDSVRSLVEKELGRRPTGPIRLLTQLRFAGFWMNPVCFYYCYQPDGVEVDAIVAEVNNTPWNEQHCYVLDPHMANTGSLTDKAGVQFSSTKEFHVSPFMGMEQNYFWTLHQPGSRFLLKLANHEHGKPIFRVDLDMSRHELTTTSMSWMVIRYPFQSLRVFAAIYWHALILWWKKCPLYPHPDQQARNRSVSLQAVPPANSPQLQSSTDGVALDSQATSETQVVVN